MNENRLKLNQSKTEFMMIGSTRQLQKMSYDSISVDGEKIVAKPFVRNLGAWFDEDLRMRKHVSEVVRIGYYHIRQLWRIRDYLTENAAKTIVHSLVCSRIDYCNALLFGISESSLSKLQRLQNCAARLVTKQSKYCNITEVLIDLHWLPVKARIDFKILLWAFKCLKGIAPIYLSELLTVRENKRTLRSSSDILLNIPKTNAKYAGDRAFEACAPRLWNNLPRDIRICDKIDVFKQKLKTHLFRKYYSVK